MRRVTIFIGILCWLVSVANAQEEADFGRINQETYRLYLEQKWDSLILAGKEALRLEVDYYYLRMRLGIAFYEKKNYRAAATHFQRAVEMNQGDQVAMEYLYFARLYAGQSRQASLVRDRFNGGLALRLPKEKGRFFGKAGMEYLYSQSDYGNSSAPLEGFFTLPAGAQPVTLHFSNYTLTLENALSPGVSLYHAYTYLSKYNHYYFSDGTGIYYDLEEQRAYQHQYYFSPRFTTPSGLSILPMIHLLSVYYQTIVSSGQGYMGGTGSTLGYVRDLDFAAGITLVKNWGPVDVSLGTSYAGLNRARQVQGKLGLMYYPLGNLNLYVGTSLNGQREWTEGGGVNRWVPDLKSGGSHCTKSLGRGRCVTGGDAQLPGSQRSHRL
jgi:hypothetical protein